MRIISATRVATLAVGLSLAAGQAYADPQDGRRHRDDATQQQQPQEEQQQQPADDRGDRHHRRGNNNTPPAAGPQAPTAGPAVQQAAPPNEGRWQNRSKHRKWVALLTRQQFDAFVSKLGLYAESTETMGSLGAPGFGFGW